MPPPENLSLYVDVGAYLAKFDNILQGACCDELLYNLVSLNKFHVIGQRQPVLLLPLRRVAELKQILQYFELLSKLRCGRFLGAI